MIELLRLSGALATRATTERREICQAITEAQKGL